MKIINDAYNIRNFEEYLYSSIHSFLNKSEFIKFKNKRGKELMYSVKSSPKFDLWYNRHERNRYISYEFGSLKKPTIYSKNIKANNSIKVFFTLEFDLDKKENSNCYFTEEEYDKFLLMKIRMSDDIYKRLKEDNYPILKEGNDFLFKINFDDTVEFFDNMLKVFELDTTDDILKIKSYLNSKETMKKSKAYEGVDYVPKKHEWVSYIRHNNEKEIIGYFKTQEEARNARLKIKSMTYKYKKETPKKYLKIKLNNNREIEEYSIL